MPATPRPVATPPAAPAWRTAPILRWLLAEGRHLGSLDALVGALGGQILAGGAPLWRLRIAVRILHPLVTATSSIWERDAGATELIDSPHGLERRPDYAGSPLQILTETRRRFRRRLDRLAPSDHVSLHELRARGATDYLGLPLVFREGRAGGLVLVTDRPGGFSRADVAAFGRIAATLAPVVELFRSRLISRAVAEAYLGPRTGSRVLAGEITRGAVERIDAAILVSDIRDWTGLNDRLDGEAALAMANRYFDTLGAAIEAQGGEILKFIGDGLLAIFPTGSGTSDRAACAAALAAARDAMARAARVEPPLGLSFGIGLHFGRVLYGNVGTGSRLDFTVTGQAVNVAARIEGLCARLGRPVLFSGAVADRLDEPLTRVSEEAIKGHRQPITVWRA